LNKIYQITEEELPSVLRLTVSGLWVIEIDGQRYYGCHTKAQAEAALKVQPVRSAYKKIW